MTGTPFVTETREVNYHADASALFAALATEHDSLLLESADIESKKNVNCIAVLQAALKVTCHGQEVTAAALTPTGEAMLQKLCTQLADHLIDNAPSQACFGFQVSTKTDERARLKDTSNAEVLRALQFHAGYEHEFLPFIGGGFAFDYLDTFEQLPLSLIHISEATRRACRSRMPSSA